MIDLRSAATLALATGMFVLHGCAGMETERPPDWQSAVEVASLADTAATSDGSRFVVGGPTRLVLVDGENGEPVSVLGEESRFEALVERASLSDSNMVTLPGAGAVLVFDDDRGSETVTALDLDSGEKRWQVSHFSYSLQQYQQVISRISSDAARTVSAITGGSGSGETSSHRRKRQRAFVQGLISPVDDGDTILFKTFNGLVSLDMRAGGENWRVREFNGPGIRQVEELDSGDYLVLSSGQDIEMLQAADAYDLARISPRGQVRWISEHAGSNTRGMYLAGSRVYVDGDTIEAFDVNDGRKLWTGPERWSLDGHTDPRYLPQPEPLTSQHGVFQAASAHGEDGEFVSTGFPHRIRGYDPDTGDHLWETGETDTFFGGLYMIDGQLIAWGAGEFFGEHEGGGIASLDPSTGERLWRTPEMGTPGVISKSAWVSEPVFDDRRERIFIAGPEDLYGMRISDGEQVLDVDLSDAGLGSLVGLTRRGNKAVVVGQDAVAAYDLDSGEQHFILELEEAVTGFSRHGQRLVVEVASGGLAAMAESQDNSMEGGGLRSIRLDRGRAGDLVAWSGCDSVGVQGVLEGGRAFVTEDGRYAITVDGDCRLIRFSL